MSATEIVGSIPNTALNATASPWRHRILTMPDGYRVVLYSNGTNLYAVTSSSGEAPWGTPQVAIAGVTALDGSITAVTDGTNLYIFRSSGSTVTCTKGTYGGSGSFSSFSTTTPITGVAPTPGSIRAVYGPAATVTDVNHSSGAAGVIHLLLDQGTTWRLYALDTHTTSATFPKVIGSTSIANGLASPTYAANLIARVDNAGTDKVFIIGPDAGGWKATEVTWGPVTVTTGGTITGSHTASYNPSAMWFSGTNSIGTPSVGNSYEWVAGVFHSFGGLGTATQPPADSPGGTWGLADPLGGAPTGLWTFPSGVWSFAGSGQVTNGGGITATPTLRIYEKSSTGVLTLKGTLTGSAQSLNSFTVSGALGSFSIAQTSSIYAEVAVTVATVTGTFPGANCYGGSLTTPTPTASGATTATVYQYTNGSSETPGVAVSTQGAALCLGDTTTNPPVDILVNAGGTVSSQQRGAAGGYNVPQTITGSATTGIAPAIIANAASGTEAAFWLQANHIWYVDRSSGIWGTPAQWDSAASTVQNGWIAPAPDAFGVIGHAGGYVAGGNAYYDDLGYASGAAPPDAPGVTLTLDANVFGFASPFVVTENEFTLEVTYHEASGSDPMSQIHIVVTDVTASVTAWDSGMTSVAPVLPGQTLAVAYGSIGAAATALIPGHEYSAVVYTKESAGGQISPGSTAVLIDVRTAPTATAVTPNPITVSNPTLGFTVHQTEGVAIGIARAQFVNPDTGATDLDTGNIAESAADGTTVSIPLSLAHKIKNNVTYQVLITLTAVATGLPGWNGTTSVSLPVVITTSLPPTSVQATWIAGSTPLDGGYVEVDYTPAASGSNPDTVQMNIYQRVVGSSLWVLAEQKTALPAVADSGKLYSVSNKQELEFGISSQDAEGFESVIVSVGTVFPLFAIWLNQASDPTICVQIGRQESQSYQGLTWTPTQLITFTELYDRTDPVVTTGTLNYYVSNDLTVVLDRGYADAMEAQLEAWRAVGTVLQIRDFNGHRFFGVIKNGQPSTGSTSVIRAYVITLSGADMAGLYTLLAL